VLRQLGFQRADKDDDLGRCSEDIEAMQEELQTLERSAERKGREIKRLEAEANSVGHQIVSAIWSDNAKRNKRMRSEAQGAVRKLNDKIAEARDKLASLENEYEQLSEPLKKLQATTESLTAEQDSAAQAIHEASQQIDERIMSTIRRLPREELGTRLERLAALAINREYFDACVRELTRDMSELDATASRMETVEAELKKAIESARQDTDSLGTAIAAGFCTTIVNRTAPVRLSGSVQFKEDHSFFGGYSGASGSATGSGSGQASYTIEEVTWDRPGEFQDLVARLCDSWAACGERSARREMLSATAASCRRGVDEWVHFIRADLERDFADS
jgi:predicted  nucleic acid-binding Zn-ribbon protein